MYVKHRHTGQAKAKRKNKAVPRRSRTEREASHVNRTCTRISHGDKPCTQNKPCLKEQAFMK